jgi:hypothetical protein
LSKPAQQRRLPLGPGQRVAIVEIVGQERASLSVSQNREIDVIVAVYAAGRQRELLGWL